ncbi:MAG: trimeric intracellular cation channel family protein [Hyphomicrobiaceae bacterium]
MLILNLLDYAGVGLFAATGALTASRRQLDLVGFVFLATITGVGGGTIRDLILAVPVFWVVNTTYLVICAGIAVIAFFTAHLIESRYRLLLWLDALALAAYGVYGAVKGLEVTGNPVIAVVMGALTATLGGILRDVLAQEQTVLMRKEIYITAAVLGAGLYVVARGLGVPLAGAIMFAVAASFALRGGALLYGWTLPAYRARPGRSYDGTKRLDDDTGPR